MGSTVLQPSSRLPQGSPVLAVAPPSRGDALLRRAGIAFRRRGLLWSAAASCGKPMALNCSRLPMPRVTVWPNFPAAEIWPTHSARPKVLVVAAGSRLLVGPEQTSEPGRVVDVASNPPGSKNRSGRPRPRGRFAVTCGFCGGGADRRGESLASGPGVSGPMTVTMGAAQ